MNLISCPDTGFNRSFNPGVGLGGVLSGKMDSSLWSGKMRTQLGFLARFEYDKITSDVGILSPAFRDTRYKFPVDHIPVDLGQIQE
jgi:hypothetical protein